MGLGFFTCGIGTPKASPFRAGPKSGFTPPDPMA